MTSQEQTSQELILPPSGLAFKNEAAARAAITHKGLGETHTVIPHEDGFAIVSQGVKPVEEKPVAEQPPKEKFFVVKFSAKSNPNDQEMVILAVNGETLVIQRECEVTIPARYCECARHAITMKYSQKPGQVRKIIGKVMTYPFETLRDGKAEDFYRAKTEGTKRTLAALERGSIERQGMPVEF